MWQVHKTMWNETLLLPKGTINYLTTKFLLTVLSRAHHFSEHVSHPHHGCNNTNSQILEIHSSAESEWCASTDKVPGLDTVAST